MHGQVRQQVGCGTAGHTGCHSALANSCSQETQSAGPLTKSQLRSAADCWLRSLNGNTTITCGAQEWFAIVMHPVSGLEGRALRTANRGRALLCQPLGDSTHAAQAWEHACTCRRRIATGRSFKQHPAGPCSSTRQTIGPHQVFVDAQQVALDCVPHRFIQRVAGAAAKAERRRGGAAVAAGWRIAAACGAAHAADRHRRLRGEELEGRAGACGTRGWEDSWGSGCSRLAAREQQAGRRRPAHNQGSSVPGRLSDRPGGSREHNSRPLRPK